MQAALNNTITNPISNLAALNIASTDVSGGFVGYLSTLYRECDMAADKKLVQDLQRTLQIIEAYQEGGMFSPLQVEQVRSTLLNAQNGILTDAQFVTNALDQFKAVLGIPINLPLILDDTAARPVTVILDRYYELIDDAIQAQVEVDKQEGLDPQKLGKLQQIFADQPLVHGTAFAKNVPGSWRDGRNPRTIKSGNAWNRSAISSANCSISKRTWSFRNRCSPRKKSARCATRSSRRTLECWSCSCADTKPNRGENRQKRAGEPGAGQAVPPRVGAGQDARPCGTNDRFDSTSKLWPEIPESVIEGIDMLNEDVEIAQEKAVQTAMRNRWDLMNARAEVVDAWRQIRVTANALLGVATVQYNLVSQTPPDGTHAVAFSAASTNQHWRSTGGLPLNRVAQRSATAPP